MQLKALAKTTEVLNFKGEKKNYQANLIYNIQALPSSFYSNYIILKGVNLWINDLPLISAVLTFKLTSSRFTKQPKHRYSCNFSST